MDAHGELAEVQGRVAVPRRVLLLALVAVALTMAYAAYLQPGWESYRDDQRQYIQLAQRLVERGEFTRAPVGEAFVPEPLRTPGYPLLLAPLCATVGCGHWQIAIAQAIAFGLVVVLVYLFVRRLAPDLAFAAAAACAFYLPIAYYAALALSDFAATAVMVLAMVLVARARSLPAALGAGAVLGFVTLVRPQFALFPLAAAAAILLAREDRSARERVRPVLAILAAAALVLVPFSAYSFTFFGAPLSSSSGWVLWNGYFHGIAAPTRRASRRSAIVRSAVPLMPRSSPRVRGWASTRSRASRPRARSARSRRSKRSPIAAPRPMRGSIWIVRSRVAPLR